MKGLLDAPGKVTVPKRTAVRGQAHKLAYINGEQPLWVTAWGTAELESSSCSVGSSSAAQAKVKASGLVRVLPSLCRRRAGAGARLAGHAGLLGAVAQQCVVAGRGSMHQ